MLKTTKHTNKTIIEVHSSRSNVLSGYKLLITNALKTYSASNTITVHSANDGIKIISDFTGNKYLALSDALILISLATPPVYVSSVKL